MAKRRKKRVKKHSLKQIRAKKARLLRAFRSEGVEPTREQRAEFESKSYWGQYGY